jgi:hypothetical protein
LSIETRARELFSKLIRDASGGRFHLATADGNAVSSTASAYHALALLHLDPALAAEELSTVYATCQGETGLLLRERPLDGSEADLFIEPPVAAFAAARVVLASDAAGRDLLERATQQLDAIWGERLPPDTDLPVILHPLESGTPDSPLFDDVVESTGGEERAEELATLARSAAACGYDPDRALRAGHTFVVEDPVFCGWFLLGLEELRKAWEKIGDTQQVQKLTIRSSMIAEAVLERLFWEEEEIFRARDRQRDEPLSALTAGGLVPAASALLTEDGRARRVSARHLAPGSGAFWGARGISANPIVRDRPGEPTSTWRGNAASGLTQYWAHLALVRAGRVADARVARAQLEALVEDSGMREFYDAIHGTGHGATDVLLPALALEMEAAEA